MANGSWYTTFGNNSWSDYTECINYESLEVSSVFTFELKFKTVMCVYFVVLQFYQLSLRYWVLSFCSGVGTVAGHIFCI